MATKLQKNQVNSMRYPAFLGKIKKSSILPVCSEFTGVADIMQIA